MTTKTLPADLLAPLLALVAKWREEAERVRNDPASVANAYNRGYTETLDECADELQAAIESLAAHRGEAVPGVMHCAKCKFRLVRTNLYVRDGTTGPGDNTTEPCPNGCGPLWPVTWENEARECWARVEELAHPPQAQAGAGDAWLPIESAPKDGGYLLLASVGGLPWQGSWRTSETRPFGKPGWTRFNSDDFGWEPTHWQPLPAPPALEASQ